VPVINPMPQIDTGWCIAGNPVSLGLLSVRYGMRDETAHATPGDDQPPFDGARFGGARALDLVHDQRTEGALCSAALDLLQVEPGRGPLGNLAGRASGKAPDGRPQRLAAGRPDPDCGIDAGRQRRRKESDVRCPSRRSRATGLAPPRPIPSRRSACGPGAGYEAPLVAEHGPGVGDDRHDPGGGRHRDGDRQRPAVRQRISRAPLLHGRKECRHRRRHWEVGVCAVPFVEQLELIELVLRHVLVQHSLRPERVKVLLRERNGSEVE
jgi:hypothetical protein